MSDSKGRDYFNCYYRGYRFQAIYHFYAARVAKSLVTVLHPHRVLDVGSARGFHVLAFKKLGVEVRGVEISKFAISQSPDEIHDSIYQVDLESGRLPFGSEQFDLVTMLEVIEHLKNFRHVLGEVKRVMRPNGFCFITTPAPPSNRDPTHVSVYPPEVWREVLHDTGLVETYRTWKLKTSITLTFHVLLPWAVRRPLDILKAIHEITVSIIKPLGLNRSLQFLLVKDNARVAATILPNSSS
jgi:2-polyprenyl-3-methyl-5-hydroxy-6-metoxy-1,4-benzoquinol methylase